MKEETPQGERAHYFEEAASWVKARDRQLQRSARTAWIVAGAAATIAVLEAVALVALTPLKTVVPFTLLVDRQTGHVETLKPLERAQISPDNALTRSFLAQYVLAREGFDIDSLQQDYRKVAIWSGGDARSRYLASMQATNPSSPLASLPRQTRVTAQVRSISSLGADMALVRFQTIRTDQGSQAQPPQSWAAVIKYRFSTGEMTAEDRLINPLGFQVLRYRRDAETIAETSVDGARTAPNAELQSIPSVAVKAPGRMAGREVRP